MKKFWKISAYVGLVLICLEIALHLYNPFTARVKNGSIVLPKNTRYTIDLPAYEGMDQHVIHSKNSIGLRGPEPNDSAKIKVICMGGSTTECMYLTDGKDWPNVLGDKLKVEFPDLWLNNAGMDGQSSYGNLQMLKQYILKLKPNYIFLMAGLNDMELDTPSHFDVNVSPIKRAYNFLELPSTIVNIIRAGKAKQVGLNHQVYTNLSQLPKLKMTDDEMMARMQKEQTYLAAYKQRITEFAKLCKDNNIQLVFIGQSILFSDENDLYTNIYLGDLKTGQMNGKTRSYILKMYNKVTFDLANELNLPFINLNARLPKDSRFFYDGYHFTIDGADMCAEILHDEITSKKIIH